MTLKALMTLGGVYFLMSLPLAWLAITLIRFWFRRFMRKNPLGSILSRGSRALDMMGKSTAAGLPPGARSPGQADRLERLRELKRMLDDRLITAAEYEAKKKDILSEI